MSQNKKEKRLRIKRSRKSGSWRIRLRRAKRQKFKLINTQTDESKEYESRIYHLKGTTGKVYKIHFDTIISCNCPDKSDICKHILYIWVYVLNVDENNTLMLQKSLLTTELNELYK